MCVSEVAASGRFPLSSPPQSLSADSRRATPGSPGRAAPGKERPRSVGKVRALALFAPSRHIGDQRPREVYISNKSESRPKTNPYQRPKDERPASRESPEQTRLGHYLCPLALARVLQTNKCSEGPASLLTTSSDARCMLIG